MCSDVHRLSLGLLLAVAVGFLALAPSAHAQSLLFTLDTPNPQEGAGFGARVAVGDVNNDGKADVAVGAYREDVGGVVDQGRAYVFSGADGSLLLTLDTPNPQTEGRFGLSVAVGDVNADGKADVAVGTRQEDVGGVVDQGRAYVFSGADGSLLLTLDHPNPLGASFGFSLAMGYVNADGKADIVVGAPYEKVGGNPMQGRAYVFSGADGSLLLTLDTPNPQGWANLGASVATGDTSGDGKADIVVGAENESPGGNPQQGRAYVFSGADGSLLLTLDTPNPQAYALFGRTVAAGDVNTDGKADVAVGSSPQGRVYVFSGTDGSLLFTLYPVSAAMVEAGDVNRDLKADVLVGQGQVDAFSGADGSLLFTLDTPNPQPYPNFGNSLAVGDVDGDGKGDIAVGAYTESVWGNGNQGRVYVFSSPPVFPVGGIAELPDVVSSSGWSAFTYGALAGAAAAALLALTAGAWYVRRRWLG